MSRSQTQNDQSVNQATLPVIAAPSRTQMKTIIAAFDTNFDNPLRLSASTTPNAVLNISANQVKMADGSSKSSPPISNTISTVVASTINFQTGATTGATFDLTFPSTTIGQYRRLGFTLLTSGTIKGIWSAQAGSIGALANPGTLFVSSGLPSGYIDLEATAATAFKTIGSATAIIENSVGGISRIFIFGSGGGGSGSGTGNEILERMKDQFLDSTWNFMTPTVIASDDITLLDVSSTGAEDLVDKTYKIDATQFALSTQFLDADFLNDEIDISSVDATVYWQLANIDNAATYQVSRNGGASYQTIAMARVGESDQYRGSLTFVADANALLDTYAVGNADSTVELNASTQQQLACSFITTAQKVFRELEVYISKTGTPSGSLRLQLVRDNAGQPSTTGTDTVISTAYLDITTLSAGNNVVTLSIGDTVLKAGTYHLVISTDSIYQASFVTSTNQISLRTDTSAPTGELAKQFNGTSWSSIATTSGTFATRGRVMDLRLKITSGTAGAKLTGFSVAYGPTGTIITGMQNQQTISFLGSANQSTFQITNFNLNPQTLKVYWKDTGKVFVAGDFTVNGTNVVFPADIFNSPGDTFTLMFDQPQGSGFDSANVNASNIAANTTKLTNIGNQISDLNFIKVGLATVPNTAIVGRAQIPDLTNDLKVSMGVERIPVQSIYPLQTEFGASGEPVFGVVNDDKQQIRFVGSWLNNVDSSGQYISSVVSGDYVEITFYGTALNILVSLGASSLDMRLSVDGAAETANIFAATYSNVLNARNYNTNQILNITSGLTLGVHTVKLRNNSVNSIKIFGFEVLNISSTLKVNTGLSYVNATALQLLTQQSPAYNSGFESGTLGTKGGRVLTYLKSDKTIGKAVTPTNASQLNLTSADHTNEEATRKYSPREFGSNRTDDFSTPASASNRAFTLEDGTTTLAGNGINFADSIESLYTGSGTSNFITITFIGTGLDVITQNLNTAATVQYNVTVDGSAAGNYSLGVNPQPARMVKIVSGLPYGTHTARFTNNSASVNGPGILSFIVYQPKKPALPAGAIELSDYNVIGNYDSSNVTGTTNLDYAQIPIGTLFKTPSREFVYIGANWSVGSLTPTVPSGFGFGTGTNNSQTTTYTFFGSGFLLCHDGSGAGTYDFSVTIDGALNSTGTAKTNSSNLGAGSYRCTNATSGVPCRIEITGLSLGFHTVTMQRTAGTGNYTFSGIYVITPIHSHKSNITYDQQNTLPVGSQSISDNRKLQLLPNSIAKKSISQAQGITSSPTTSATSFVPCPDMSLVIQSPGDWFDISFAYTALQSGLNSVYAAIFVNGVQVGPTIGNTPDASHLSEISVQQYVYLPVGTHKIDGYWRGDAGTTTAHATYRYIRAKN